MQPQSWLIIGCPHSIMRMPEADDIIRLWHVYVATDNQARFWLSFHCCIVKTHFLLLGSVAACCQAQMQLRLSITLAKRCSVNGLATCDTT